MNSAQRFLANEPLKGLDAQGELADREGSLAAKMTIAEAFQVSTVGATTVGARHLTDGWCQALDDQATFGNCR